MPAPSLALGMAVTTAAALALAVLAAEAEAVATAAGGAPAACPTVRAAASSPETYGEDVWQALAMEGADGRGARHGEEPPPKAAVHLAQRARLLQLARRRGRGGHATAHDPRLPSIGFVKLHKTGGGTLANILDRLAVREGLRKVLPKGGPRGIAMIHWPLLEAAEPAQHQYDLVSNHQVFNETAMRAYLRPGAVLFTLLREPLAVIDSVCRFRREGSLTWGGHLEYMANKSKFMNPSSRYLGWYDDIELGNDGPQAPEVFQHDHDVEAIDAFIQRLDRTLDLVLLAEHFDEGLLMLRRKLGLPLAAVRYVRLHADDLRTEMPPPTAEERRRLEDFVAVDQAVYKHFLRKFRSAWDVAGGNATFGAELAELRAENNALAHSCGQERTAWDKDSCPEEFLLDSGNFNKARFDSSGRPLSAQAQV